MIALPRNVNALILDQANLLSYFFYSKSHVALLIFIPTIREKLQNGIVLFRGGSGGIVINTAMAFSFMMIN